MITRYASENDLPAIIDLFKVSLGEQGGIPEISFWKWKHEQNPFGKSPTILAYDKDKLIGLRTFLSWRFIYKGNSFKAYRAVDTATHPDYRGKGIFRTLTLALIEDLKKGEPSVIFNTPNDQSRPGYLKMGWKIVGKTPLIIRPFPLHMARNFLVPFTAAAAQHADWVHMLENLWESIAADSKKIWYNRITTDVNMDYLTWRYRDIPGFTYQCHIKSKGNDHCVLFFRMKQSGRLRELRVTDLFFNAINKSIIRHTIHEIAEQYKPDVITIVEDNSGIISSVLPYGFIKAKRVGLLVTCREVNSKTLSELAEQNKFWYFNAGSFELF